MKTICAGTNSKCLDKINDTCHKWKQWEKTFLVDIVWYTFRNAWNRHISWCGKDGTLTEEQTIDATASTCFISSLGMSRAAYAMASWTIGAWVVSRNVMQCLFLIFFVYCICIGYELYAASSQIYDMMICIYIYMILWDIFTKIWTTFRYISISSRSHCLPRPQSPYYGEDGGKVMLRIHVILWQFYIAPCTVTYTVCAQFSLSPL